MSSYTVTEDADKGHSIDVENFPQPESFGDPLFAFLGYKAGSALTIVNEHVDTFDVMENFAQALQVIGVPMEDFQSYVGQRAIYTPDEIREMSR